MKTFPLDALLVQARQQYTTPSEVDILETALNGILNDANSTSVEHKLAELLYFRWGYMLVEHMQYNKMTRLQMEHECLARALLASEQLSAISDFALRVLVKADQEQISYAQNLLAFRSGPLSPIDSGYCTGEGVSDDNNEVSEDDQGKAIYIRSWNPKLNRTITYRY